LEQVVLGLYLRPKVLAVQILLFQQSHQLVEVLVGLTAQRQVALRVVLVVDLQQILLVD